ncbi:DUF4115 domain-containing protein [Thalassococcus sp. CAU 1522]|uniref:DUF4115 domain-containing protein n=1 Tax=Thalassococcus arenae TaxID=2851652 RepID=A0ABS6NAG5_9RHOB|nr:helix-turn-helix domain-containing protein [Thalassococcus arenae]MBV2361013.1 DUF4115 domain-containing protein [Thalassococcus arenae]
MIGRKSDKKPDVEDAKLRSFDDFDLRLGDIMRGERATMGKSLLDVQRELRIKASYIAAIENCDPSAFDTPGFIAGYVRSYARYLDLNPDEAFAQFCAESGFSVAHGMSQKASTIRKPSDPDQPPRPKARDPFTDGKLPFAPQADSVLSRIEPGAIGSTLVLLGLVAGIGYGGWFVLQEVQRVQVAPVEQTPIVLSDLDPLNSPSETPVAEGTEAPAAAGVFTPPTTEAFDRLYRPQALDVPVLVARDAPISTLDPESVGVFARAGQPDGSVWNGRHDEAQRLAAQDRADPAPSVLQQHAGVTLVAVRPVWIRVRDDNGAVLREGILNAGDTWPVPATAAAPRVQVGESGALYFAAQGKVLGPAGPRGSVTANLPLDAAELVGRYAEAEAPEGSDLSRVLADLGHMLNTPEQTVVATGPTVPPKVYEDGQPAVTIVAVREAWVRVKSASGATVHETIMQPGEVYTVPQMEQAPTIRTGDAGAIFFAVNGQTYGPYGSNGQVADNLALSVDTVTTQFAATDPAINATLAKTVAELGAVAAPADQN